MRGDVKGGHGCIFVLGITSALFQSFLLTPASALPHKVPHGVVFCPRSQVNVVTARDGQMRSYFPPRRVACSE